MRHILKTRHSLPPPSSYLAVRARYGEQGLLELTAVMSVYTMNAAILRVMDHQAAADARHLTPR